LIATCKRENRPAEAANCKRRASKKETGARAPQEFRLSFFASKNKQAQKKHRNSEEPPFAIRGAGDTMPICRGKFFCRLFRERCGPSRRRKKVWLSPSGCAVLEVNADRLAAFLAYLVKPVSKRKTHYAVFLREWQNEPIGILAAAALKLGLQGVVALADVISDGGLSPRSLAYSWRDFVITVDHAGKTSERVCAVNRVRSLILV
jgi:hypothetical protein